MQFKITFFYPNQKVAMVEYNSTQTILLVEGSTQDVIK
jgi:hypothetical protein